MTRPGDDFKLRLERLLVRDDLKLLGLKRLLRVLFNGTNNPWVHQEGQEREPNHQAGHKVLSIQQVLSTFSFSFSKNLEF